MIEIYCVDWLPFAAHLSPASIDLLYADPPFNTGDTQSDRNGQYADRFDSTAAYITWLRERLAATLPALKPTANILIHIDWRTSHRVRVMLDDLLGASRFVNHLIWQYGLGGSSPRRFARKHDDILFYCLDPERYLFDPPMVPATSNRMRGRQKKATDVLDIPSINNMAAERVGYPTQKPLALLDLLVRACCPPGGTVLDPCCGSGTTLVAAVRSGRRAIGCDINPDAVRIARSRLAAERDASTSEHAIEMPASETAATGSNDVPGPVRPRS
ncbi:MAG: site-specific DNA-methyltransferase [Phycisphaerales bacterium]|nr:site-specific DNA-methyltransferase [Phycisphaerales bacterium]